MAAIATIGPAMWFQASSNAYNLHLTMIFIGVIAISIALMAVVLVAIAVKALVAIKKTSASAEEVKEKLIPLLDEMMVISRTSRVMLQETAPKVKVIADNLLKTTETLVDASNVARSSVKQFDVTLTDVNVRAKKQVARVDGMVTAALTTTAEVADTIANGIRGPVEKLALMATQARFVAEGLLGKVKAMAANSPFGARGGPSQG